MGGNVTKTLYKCINIKNTHECGKKEGFENVSHSLAYQFKVWYKISRSSVTAEKKF